MRYKVIDNKRLNIYLTQNDLIKENVAIDNMEKKENVEKLKSIFDAVSVLAEFNINNQSLNIVLMPVADGDLIISAGVVEEDSKSAELVFEFDEFENLLGACVEINGCKILSSLYKMGENYYLVIKINEKYVKKVCSIASEYGEKIDICSQFINEHGKIIIKNCAFDTIKEKFSRL